jgi:hypothetical protein
MVYGVWHDTIYSRECLETNKANLPADKTQTHKIVKVRITADMNQKKVNPFES